MGSRAQGVRSTAAACDEDLVVISHLRWDWVWQRPQHIVSRLAAGRRTWFIEEPRCADVDEAVVRVEDSGPVTRAWLDVPGDAEYVQHDDPVADDFGDIVAELVGEADRRTTWLYTPLGMGIADALGGDALVYDVMDDLASFKDAPPRLVSAQREALERADVVFAGGRSLYAGIADHAEGRAHLFPSGVEPEHYAQARDHRRPRRRPVAGYVGVIDERIDLDLVEGLAARLPDWDIQMVGPVTKISAADLPVAPNLHYPGKQPYERLPQVMGGFDVALMPFALNDATRSISPTKTLEYLAAGLPVVSTPVPDVVADFAELVHVCSDADDMATACRGVLGHDLAARDARLRPVLDAARWDSIAARMEVLMQAAHDDAATSARRGARVAA